MFKQLYQEYLQANQGKTWRQKLEYIWYYYKTVIGLVIVALVLLVGVIGHFATAKEPLLKVIMINPTGATATAEEPYEDFFQAYGYESFDGAVMCSQFDLRNEDDPYYPNNLMAATVQLEVEQDLFLGEGDTYMDLVDRGMLADLSQILPEDVLERYEDQLLYCKPDGSAAYPCAIWLEDNAWLTASGLYEACYFGVAVQSCNPETAAEFAEYVLK